MQGNKAGSDFVMRNDIEGLIGTNSIPVVYSSVPNTEILGQWENLVGVVGKLLGNRIALEGDDLRILTQFTRSMTRICHMLLQNARLLCNHFFEVHVRHVWRKGNMYADFVVNKRSRWGAQSVWKGNFPRRLIELAMKNVSKFYYERLWLLILS